jgi:exonuclease SbcC
MIYLRRLAVQNFKQLRDVELVLPPRGRFLVQGKNEAGKSTLFEAVFFALFGQALVAETSARRLDDLIGYGLEKARVELDVAVRDRLLRIARTIVRDKPNLWELDIVQGGQTELVRGNEAVTRRIVQELGFDGDALLNTCFVEQKKLEKLEGMGRQERERSLMKLLNLETMQRLEDEFKVRGEDRLALRRYEQRRELAEIQDELPGRQKRQQEVEARLFVLNLRQTLEALAEEQRAIQALDAAIAERLPELERLTAQAQRANTLREGLLALREVIEKLERLGEQQAEAERLAAELAQREQLARETLPALTARLADLGLLRSRLARLGQVAAARQERERAQTELARTVEELQAKAERLASEEARRQSAAQEAATQEARLGELNGKLRRLETVQALDDWLVAQEAVAAPEQLAAQVAQAQGESQHLWQDLTAAVADFLQQVAAARSLAALRASVQEFLAGLLERIRLAIETAQRLGRLEGQAQLLVERQEVAQAQLAAARRSLAGLGEPVPSDLPAARHRLAELSPGVAGLDVQSLRADVEPVRNAAAHARAALGEIERGIARLQAEIAGRDVALLAAQQTAAASAAAKAQGLIARWQPRALALAGSLGVAADLGAVQGLIGSVGAEAREVRRRLGEREALARQRAEREQAIADLWRGMEERYAAVLAAALEAPAWRRSLRREDYQALGRRLAEEYERLGGEAVRRQLEAVQTALGRAQGEREARQRTAQTLIAQAQDSLRKLRVDLALSDAAPLAEVEMLLTRLQSIDVGDEEALKAEKEELSRRVYPLQDRQRALEAELGLAGEVLDVARCRQELEAKRREIAVRERALRITETARRRVVEKVLPSTLDHLRRLLPQLTQDRYHDAELTEDYKLRLWDERAGEHAPIPTAGVMYRGHGAWKEKNIFSGGTKDQFSLALRLAFALATLPEERGAAPGFIFLDEPLGSFDEERAGSLLALLTTGEVAQSFEQIFLISHVRVSPHLFNYHLTLDGGRVVESDLEG